MLAFKGKGKDPLCVISSPVLAKVLEILLLNQVNIVILDNKVPKLTQTTNKRNVGCSDSLWDSHAILSCSLRDICIIEPNCFTHSPVEESDSGSGAVAGGEESTFDTTTTETGISSRTVEFRFVLWHWCYYNIQSLFQYVRNTTYPTSALKPMVPRMDLTHAVPYLFIRTELCGKTLKEWLNTHKKRKRKLMLSFLNRSADTLLKVALHE